MIQYDTLGHINIIVDDVERATEFYVRALGAVPMQDFPHFRNIGFAKSAGFLEHPENVDVTIRFLRLPTPDGVFIERGKCLPYPAAVLSAEEKSGRLNRDVKSPLEMPVTSRSVPV